MDTETLDAIREARDLIEGYIDVNDGPDGQPVPNNAMRAASLLNEAIAEEESRTRALLRMSHEVKLQADEISVEEAAAEFDALYPRQHESHVRTGEPNRRHNPGRRKQDRVPRNTGWIFAVHEFSVFFVGACIGAVATIIALYWRVTWPR